MGRRDRAKLYEVITKLGGMPNVEFSMSAWETVLSSLGYSARELARNTALLEAYREAVRKQYTRAQKDRAPGKYGSPSCVVPHKDWDSVFRSSNSDPCSSEASEDDRKVCPLSECAPRLVSLQSRATGQGRAKPEGESWPRRA